MDAFVRATGPERVLMFADALTFSARTSAMVGLTFLFLLPLVAVFYLMLLQDERYAPLSRKTVTTIGAVVLTLCLVHLVLSERYRQWVAYLINTPIEFVAINGMYFNGPPLLAYVMIPVGFYLCQHALDVYKTRNAQQ
jgi:hypothetical protein